MMLILAETAILDTIAKTNKIFGGFENGRTNDF